MIDLADLVRVHGSRAVPPVVHAGDFATMADCFAHPQPLLSWERIARSPSDVTCAACKSEPAHRAQGEPR